MQNNLLVDLREGKTLTARQQLLLMVQLSLPAMLAQISSIVMQYIDASMVGRLGANDSAAIGLVASSTWLLGGLCSAAGIGFTVQVAQLIGAKKDDTARLVTRMALLLSLGFSGLLLAVGAGVSGILPGWLGGGAEICGAASRYFLIYALFLPATQMVYLAGGLLQCSGNMRTPGLLHVLMCGLDILLNFFFIFPTRQAQFGAVVLSVPGLGLGVAGAALGTALAESVGALLMLYALLVKSPALHLRRGEPLRFPALYLERAVKIALPVAFEQTVMCGAQVLSTRIVSPLGTVAIAANSFSVTAESLCYMPGYGIGAASTTLIGQSIGAGRQDLTRRLGWLCTGFGMAVMAGSGALLYLLAPWMLALLTPDAAIQTLGTAVLRIEAFAEPMYAASIVAAGVFRGAGDTLVPSAISFASMWLVRLPLAAFLAPRMGLRGVWLAMCIELCVRGALCLLRLAGRRWQGKA